MNSPIVDFVKNYASSGVSRFHMPGHKGKKFLGPEKLDITEISGADVLSNARGIINESEKNATLLFGSGRTFYSTEGSTSVICAMLSMVKNNSERTCIIAARNVHKSFVHACALLDLDVTWLMSEDTYSLLKCEISAHMVEVAICKSANKPAAVYLTSPDYLGNIQPISEIAKVCTKYDIPLLVDNAHGAYLGFLNKSIHPIHLGATLCCDSAHKTLPVLTGGAYLHISKDASGKFSPIAREKLSLFTSTSPSYLILQSLDLCNIYLNKTFKKKLNETCLKVDEIKEFAKSRGIKVLPSEPLKITIDASASGYSGDALAMALSKNKIEVEFSDRDYVVLMCTPQNSDKDFNRLKKVFSLLQSNGEIPKRSFPLSYPITKKTIREALFSESEQVDVSQSIGRIFSSAAVSCPPAVPIAISGEEITKEMSELFEANDINKVCVLK